MHVELISVHSVLCVSPSLCERIRVVLMDCTLAVCSIQVF